MVYVINLNVKRKWGIVIGFQQSAVRKRRDSEIPPARELDDFASGKKDLLFRWMYSIM